MKRMIKVWWLLTMSSAKIAFESRFGVTLFMLGKVLRFVFFMFFLVLLLFRTKSLAGYPFWTVILFYLTFNFLDTLAQLLFRNVYRFNYSISSGEFDYDLIRPVSPLMVNLLGGTDPLDTPMLFVFLGGIILCFSHMGPLSIFNIILYIVLLCNGFLIATSFHIFVLALGILTTAVDNTIMLYRDITQMGRLPVDIYKDPLRSIITFVVPVGIMMTFPVKVLTGLLSFQLIVIALVVGMLFFSLSVLCWKYALRQYASASS
ncbi:MAG: ABC-2 family transporter protein [Patescibacteria group bacterium]|nr:ABC-2 family transporter protein [Patescibacteria group bacterium]